MSRRLGNRYELYEQIGGGGMAVVYRAMDTALGRPVAVKMLRSQYVNDEELVERFRQEAQSVAKLAHPNIVNIYDVGIADGEDYIVMEYVDGPTLKEIIRERGPLSAKETVAITSQICQALEHAHANHIVHRDIKPHNILLTRSGQVKVTDFGIARAITGDTVTYHNEKSVLGSVHYFSPEQARGGSADVKSDIYSLGVVMYEMLTGRLPFSGDSAVSVALKHLRDEFIDPRSINPTIPQSLENIVLRCLVKAPDGRYADMRAVRHDLDVALANPDVPKFQRPQSVTQATIAVPAITAGDEDQLPSTPGLRNGSDKSRRKRDLNKAAQKEKRQGRGRLWSTLAWVGIAVAVLVVGALAAYYIVMRLIQVPDVNLPNVVGKTESQAVSQLEQAGFSQNQIVEHTGTSTKAKGVVYQQNPTAGQVKQNRQVTIYVSSGAPKFPMPDLSGLQVDAAKSVLSDDGFAASNIQVQQASSTDYPSGEVISSKPAAGIQVSSDQTVTLTVSKGAPQVAIPPVLGKQLSQASQLLYQVGLTVGTISEEANSQPAGTVVSIAPNTVGQSVDKGSSVNLVVSDGSLAPPTGGNGNSTANNATGTNNTTGMSNAPAGNDAT